MNRNVTIGIGVAVVVVCIVIIVLVFRNKSAEYYPDNTSSTAINVLYSDTNGNMGSTVLIPPGSIIMWTGSVAPPGWAICDGQYGTPDLRGKFVLGYGNGKNIDNKGGSETVTLTASQIPSHTHLVRIGSKSGSTSTDGNHKHRSYYINPRGTTSWWNGSSWGPTDEWTDTTEAGNHSHNVTVDVGNITSDETGGGQSHDNMPPYFVLAYIMKL